MNYVDQAYSLTKEQKNTAKALYKESVKELINKQYKYECDDAHTELSAIFGEKYLISEGSNGAFWHDAQQYAQANTAFNYANLNLGISGRFIKLSKELVCDDERISDERLIEMSEQMNCILTRTTAEDWSFV